MVTRTKLRTQAFPLELAPRGEGGAATQPCAPPSANSYSVGDAEDFLRSFPSGSLSGIATSPPYNKRFNGRTNSNWKGSKLMAEAYENHNDNMDEDNYVQWQRAILSESMRVVGEDGVVVYNIGRRIKSLREDRREEIVRGFPVRQTVIWNRGSTHNQGGKRPSIFPPIYELVYIIAGDKWKLPQRRLSEFRKWGDVWSIPFQTRGNPHPAPFPLELAQRMVKVVDGPIADPFAGSGTIGVAADKLGVPYYLNDNSPSYRTMFQKRLEQTRMSIGG